MIVNEGKIQLLTAQYAFLAACTWRLFINNETITAATVLEDLTEASFTGYEPKTVGTMGTATIVSGRASSSPVSPPVWTNGESGDVEVYGWMLVDPTETYVVAAVNRGLTTIPAGSALAWIGAITNTQE